MPYFNHLMAASISDKKSSEKSKTVRTMPGATKSGKVKVQQEADPTISSQYRQNLSQRKLLFMRSLLRSQIDQLVTSAGAYDINKVPKMFEVYKINFNNLLHETPELKIYEAKNVTTPEFIMMVRIYDPKQMDPQNSLYLKMLRHLGRKHPYIIHTWELFYDADHIYVFQEFVTRGNLMAFLEINTVDEKQACFWARQIYRALDFLGDIGIAHRSITPNHLVVKAMGAETWIKLTGFKDSLIYWDSQGNDVKFCACWPAERQKQDGPNFQAPEVYGNPQTETFDPILADIWSFGANLYYMIAKQYPYNIMEPSDELDEEVHHNIQAIPNLSDPGRKFIGGLLKSNANNRIPFEFIEKDPWVRRTGGLTKGVVAKTQNKVLEKVKVARSTASKVSTASRVSAAPSVPSVLPSISQVLEVTKEGTASTANLSQASQSTTAVPQSISIDQVANTKSPGVNSGASSSAISSTSVSEAASKPDMSSNSSISTASKVKVKKKMLLDAKSRMNRSIGGRTCKSIVKNMSAAMSFSGKLKPASFSASHSKGG